MILARIDATSTLVFKRNKFGGLDQAGYTYSAAFKSRTSTLR